MVYRIIGRKQHHYTKSQAITTFSVDEMRDQIDREYNHRFVTRALAPHDYVKQQYILWPKRKVARLEELNTEEAHELMQIMQQRHDDNYTCMRNCLDDVTVPVKLHFHISQFHYVTDLAGVTIGEHPKRQTTAQQN